MLDLLLHLFHNDHGERAVVLFVADQWSTLGAWSTQWFNRAWAAAERASGVPEAELRDKALSALTGAGCLLFAVGVPAAVYYLTQEPT